MNQRTKNKLVTSIVGITLLTGALSTFREPSKERQNLLQKQTPYTETYSPEKTEETYK